MSKSDITGVEEILADLIAKTRVELFEDKPEVVYYIKDFDGALAAIQSLILQARIEERVKLAQQPLEALPSIFLNDEDVQKRLKAINSIDGGGRRNDCKVW